MNGRRRKQPRRAPTRDDAYPHHFLKGGDRYDFSTKQDQTEARKWLEKHRDELPSMEDGRRIGGDPIIYAGLPEEWQLRGLATGRFEDELCVDASEDERRGTWYELMKAAVPSSRMSCREAWIVILSLMRFTQKEIAGTLQISQQAVSRDLRAGINKIRSGRPIAA